MKKFLLALCCAFAAVGAYAQADTPADGAYFLYNVDHDAFLVRNGAWGTQVVLDVYGQPVTIETTGGNSILNFLDQKGVENWTIYIDGAGGLYTDRNYDNQWSIEANDGSYVIKSKTNNSYLTINTGQAVKYPQANGELANAAHWEFWSGEKYGKWLEAKRVAQFNGLLQKAGLADVVETEAEIADVLPNEIDFTSEVSLPSGRGELYQPANDNNGNLGNYLEPVNFKFTAPQTGVYRIEMPAMYRIASNVVAADAVKDGVDYFNATVFTSDFTGTVMCVSGGMTTQKLDDNSHGANIGGVEYYWPNGEDGFQAWAKNGKYLNTVYAYAEAGKEINVKIQLRGGRVWNQQWLVYNYDYITVTLLAKNEEANLDEYNEAIAEMIAKLGFGPDECAPYKNVEAMKVLEEALAADVFFDQDLADSYALALNSAALEMTPNGKELNAVYNGDFLLCQNDGGLPGWISSTGNELGNASGPYHSRAFVYTEGENYTALGALQLGDGPRAAAYFRFDGQQSKQTTKYIYGQDGWQYAMPLHAGVEYELTLDYGAWNITPRDTRFYVVDAAGKTVANRISIPEDIFKGGKGTNVAIKFTPSVDGNCSLVAQNPGATDNAAFNNDIVVTNISIRKAIEAGEDPGKGGIVFVEGEQEPVAVPATYYDMQGMKVNNPIPGRAYIEIKDGKAAKVIF